MAERTLAALFEQQQNQLLDTWMRLQQKSLQNRVDLITESELRSDSQNFLSTLRGKVPGPASDLASSEWSSLREFLNDLSRRRATQGFTPSETATFILSLKQPLFERLADAGISDPRELATELWSITTTLDRLALYTAEAYLKSREALISRQQQEMLELSTPVVELWQGILAVPLIGTLDSSRTQVVMQNLLDAIVAKRSGIAIIDITGVPTVDTLVAQHLLKTVAAARLMGAECIISGIRPQIAQTIIHLGVDLGNVITKATLADAFYIALRKLSLAVTKQ